LQSPTHARQTTLPKPILFYLSASLFLSFVCVMVILLQRYVRHSNFNYHWFFLLDNPQRDLWCYQPQFLKLHNTGFFSASSNIEMFPYPPGSVLITALFNNLLPKFHSIPYFFLSFLGIAGLAAGLEKTLEQLDMERWKAILLATASLLLFFPLYFAWMTGNIEVIIFLLLAAGVLSFLRGNFILAAVLIGYCGSTKFYPIVLIALFLPVRRYKEIAVAMVAFFASLFAGLWLACSDLHVAYFGLRMAMKTNRVDYMQSYMFPQSMADHSLWGLFKSVGFMLTKQEHYPSWALSTYMAITASLGFALFFGRIRKLPLLNQITCLYLCLLLLVPESFEYTLLHLALPCGLLLLYTVQLANEGRSVRSLFPAFLCMAFVLSADIELVYARHGFWGQAKCLALVALLGMALASRWDGLEKMEWISPSLRRRDLQ
jgi:hypothetical protein